MTWNHGRMDGMSDWITVVDDTAANLRTISHILTAEQMRVSALRSGEKLLEFLESNTPDLILLDVHMPQMNGFEALKKIRQMEGAKQIPVIFLTADEDVETETRGLEAGAMDFIKKPFIPAVLLVRVRHTIELTRLQRNLSEEVEKKTLALKKEYERNERLSIQIVQSLSSSIDEKDTYTSGHSMRVAQYSGEIARRSGYSEQEQKEIYMAGLLHDVGKIGVPDAIINKPSRLTDEEYSMIKNHPVMGARILKNITELPSLVTGARWHHERYDGKGYPDGLSGEAIPEAARIIAVADAYDAMTSNRSYRGVLSQEYVRGEIEKGKGTQFDPKFADVMMQMIDEDIHYAMRE